MTTRTDTETTPAPDLEVELEDIPTPSRVWILDRDDVREGDVVKCGALGYYFEGPIVSGATLNERNGTDDYVDDDLLLGPVGLSWYANFVSAYRAA